MNSPYHQEEQQLQQQQQQEAEVGQQQLLGGDMLISRRSLYDEKFLDANCDVGIVAYDEGTGVDNSPWTYGTTYVIGIVCILLAILIYRSDRNNNMNKQQQQTQQQQRGSAVLHDTSSAWSLCIFFMATGLGDVLGAYGHQAIVNEDDDVPINHAIPRFSYFFLLLGNAYLFRLAITYQTSLEQSWKMALWMVANVPYTAIAVGLKNMTMTKCAMLLGATSMAVTHFQQYSTSNNKLIATKGGCMTAMVIAFLMQARLDGVCGYGGYEDCFEKCPLPAPTFNHNALFNIITLICFILYGILELIVPADDYVTILHPKQSSGSTRSLSAGGGGGNNNINNNNNGAGGSTRYTASSVGSVAGPNNNNIDNDIIGVACQTSAAEEVTAVAHHDDEVSSSI